MSTLFDLCTLIRSKNAGPFMLTFDFLFASRENYERARRVKPITKELLSSIYGIPEEDISVIYHDSALAIKASMPQRHFQGDLENADGYGGQQYVPLLHLEVD